MLIEDYKPLTDNGFLAIVARLAPRIDFRLLFPLVLLQKAEFNLRIDFGQSHRVSYIGDAESLTHLSQAT